VSCCAGMLLLDSVLLTRPVCTVLCPTKRILNTPGICNSRQTSHPRSVHQRSEHALRLTDVDVNPARIQSILPLQQVLNTAAVHVADNMRSMHWLLLPPPNFHTHQPTLCLKAPYVPYMAPALSQVGSSGSSSGSSNTSDALQGLCEDSISTMQTANTKMLHLCS
jgi:hypothetical protein